MLKKTQNYLLLNHPLLWNIKFVPVFIIAAIINLLFFFGGYIYGVIDFTEINDSYRYNDSTPVFVIFLSIILSLLVLIIWIVYYIRNNAFKTFYPKKRMSLFKEWGLIFILCIVNCSYFISFTYAYELRARHYYEKNELAKRLDILSKASIFTQGGYDRSEDTVINQQDVKLKNFIYSGKKYQFSSLLNKSMENFTLQSREKDSINKRTVMHWLVENRKDSVRNILVQFQNIATGHNLKSNITTEQWMDLVYDYPEFINYKVVGNDNFSPVYGYNSNYIYDEYNDEYNYIKNPIDLSMNIREIVKKDTIYYPKYYVPLSQLKSAYSKMSKAWVNPEADTKLLIGLLYFALGLSVLIFSFRVTSGRSWLIAAVSGGILVVITALISVIISETLGRQRLLLRNEHLFIAIWAVLTIILLIYYCIALRKKSKGILGIVLNLLLWLLPFLLPIIYNVSHKLAASLNIDYIKDEGYVLVEHPLYIWLDQYMGIMFLVNLVLVIPFMYYFTISIKKWKGIAEG